MTGARKWLCEGAGLHSALGADRACPLGLDDAGRRGRPIYDWLSGNGKFLAGSMTLRVGAFGALEPILARLSNLLGAGR